jgi:hypothetical protein
VSPGDKAEEERSGSIGYRPSEHPLRAELIAAGIIRPAVGPALGDPTRETSRDLEARANNQPPPERGTSAATSPQRKRGHHGQR